MTKHWPTFPYQKEKKWSKKGALLHNLSLRPLKNEGRKLIEFTLCNFLYEYITNARKSRGPCAAEDSAAAFAAACCDPRIFSGYSRILTNN